MTPPSQARPPHVGMLQLLNGAHVAGAVSCLAELGIPDLVEAGPKSAEELATQIRAQPTGSLPSHARHGQRRRSIGRSRRKVFGNADVCSSA